MRLRLVDVIHATAADVIDISVPGEARRNALSVADLESELGPVIVDSRAVEDGALFVALPGDHVDGHHFVGQAIAGGARASIVDQTSNPAQAPLSVARADSRGRAYLILVKDPLTALGDVATYWRSRHEAEIIGITGSIGKTTAKEIVASILGYRWPILKNPGNFNTEIGLPLTLLQLAPRHRAAVLEMGMYGIGDIATLATIARPRIGIVTNVAPIHLERLGSIERIARAKSELIAALPSDGLAILNGDNAWTRAMAITSGIARSILVGLAPECQYRAADITACGLTGVHFTLHADGREITLDTRVPGTHTVSAFLAGIAVAREMGMNWDETRDAVNAASLDARQRILRGRGGMLLIDDSYNAAPQSMSAALKLLAAAPGGKIAVLGDMLELGPHEEEAHREVGREVASVADWLVVRGPRSEWLAESAVDAGFDPGHVLHVDSNLAGAEAALRITSSQSVSRVTAPTMPLDATEAAEASWSVLVKGSRGMRMEEIVERLSDTGERGA
ncbi:MAG: UDP-N-acetylmuramoyl-tripeptide--D-alanyl-D-alanine ligase [Chloroflexota bacterium]